MAKKKSRRIRYWRCRQCGHLVECPTIPHPRLVVNYSLSGLSAGDDGLNKHGALVRSRASGSCTISTGYGALCFGGERGEDYYSHDWASILKKEIERRYTKPRVYKGLPARKRGC